MRDACDRDRCRSYWLASMRVSLEMWASEAIVRLNVHFTMMSKGDGRDWARGVRSPSRVVLIGSGRFLQGRQEMKLGAEWGVSRLDSAFATSG